MVVIDRQVSRVREIRGIHLSHSQLPTQKGSAASRAWVPEEVRGASNRECLTGYLAVGNICMQKNFRPAKQIEKNQHCEVVDLLYLSTVLYVYRKIKTGVCTIAKREHCQGPTV